MIQPSITALGAHLLSLHLSRATEWRSRERFTLRNAVPVSVSDRPQGRTIPAFYPRRNAPPSAGGIGNAI